MLKDFWDKEALLIRISAFLTGVGALFLNITLPQSEKAKVALENMQIFWLFLIAVTVTALFAKFVVWAFKKEKEIGKHYDNLTFGIVSFLIGTILLWVILNFLSYISNLYPDRFNEFFGFALPLVIIVFLITLLNSTVKYKEKFTLISKIIVESFVMSFFAVISWTCIQWSLWTYAQFSTFYLVFPCVFGVLFILLVGASMYRKEKLFKPLGQNL